MSKTRKKEKINNYLDSNGNIDWERLIGKTIVYRTEPYPFSEKYTRDVLEMTIVDFFVDDDKKVYIRGKNGMAWNREIHKDDILFVFVDEVIDFGIIKIDKDIKLVKDKIPLQQPVINPRPILPPVIPYVPYNPPTWTGDPPATSPTITCCNGDCGCSESK